MKLPILLCIVPLFAFETLTAQQASSPSAVQTPVPGSLEAELVSLTNEWTSAILAKDRSKLDALMSPDFVLHGWDGSWHTERPQWLENLFQSYDIAEYHHSDIVPHIYGDVAAIASKWYWRGASGRNEKKPHEQHGYVLDVWRRANGRWQVVSRITIIIPGKEEPASSAAPN
jgi:ketosteroid isomerase-like protein